MDNNEIKYLSGSPVPLEGIFVHPLKLREIAELGVEKFNSYLSLLLVENKVTYLSPEYKINSFEYLCFLMENNREDGIEFKDALSKVLKTNVFPVLKEDTAYLLTDDGVIINFQLFEKMQDIIKHQCFIGGKELKKKFNPANDKARELKEKLDRIKTQLNKDNADRQIDITDIISIVSAYTPNINIVDIWDLTIYQLYQLYMRLIMKDNYETELQQVMQGVDPKSLKLKHWAGKLEKDT